MSKRILVIDDETNVRTMIRLTLEHSGYEVQSAEDGAVGLQLLKSGPPMDLVLVDYRMPGLNGQEVQDEIHKLSPSTHVVLMTAFGTLDLAVDAIHAGATDFLRKPFTAEMLRNTVKLALESTRTVGAAIPIDKVCKPFSRTNINGYSLQADEDSHHAEESDGRFRSHFVVMEGSGKKSYVDVVLESFVAELVKAHLDTEEVPSGERFWAAFCEEALALYLRDEAQLPPRHQLVIKDLSTCLEEWLDSVSTVEI